MYEYLYIAHMVENVSNDIPSTLCVHKKKKEIEDIEGTPVLVF